MTLKVEHLFGGYQRKEIIKDLNFTIQTGEIVGLVGLNGAGKSTTIRHIMGLMKPYRGSVQINGLSPVDDEESYHKSLAYIPETPLLYDELTLREHLELTAMTYDIPKQEALERADTLLDAFRLKRELDWYPIDFSKGMKQKVMIVCAFMTQPQVLIIDEPFIGLDPIAMRDLNQLMITTKENGTAILMSTHVLANINQVCDRVIVLHQGQIIGQGTLKDLANKFKVPQDSMDKIFDQLLKDESFTHQNEVK